MVQRASNALGVPAAAAAAADESVPAEHHHATTPYQEFVKGCDSGLPMETRQLEFRLSAAVMKPPAPTLASAVAYATNLASLGRIFVGKIYVNDQDQRALNDHVDNVEKTQRQFKNDAPAVWTDVVAALLKERDEMTAIERQAAALCKPNPLRLKTPPSTASTLKKELLVFAGKLPPRQAHMHTLPQDRQRVADLAQAFSERLDKLVEAEEANPTGLPLAKLRKAAFQIRAASHGLNPARPAMFDSLLQLLRADVDKVCNVIAPPPIGTLKTMP